MNLPPSPQRVLIVGCGYLGLAAALRFLAAGCFVAGVRRSPDSIAELSDLGIQPLVGDVARPDTWRDWPRDWDVVVNAVSSSRGGPEVYRDVYWAGTRHLIEWVGPSLRRYVHIGSTSVYAQTDGSWVDEDSPTEPTTETGQILVETENEVRSAHASTGFPGVLLRVSGIYGPSRGHLLKQLLQGEARIEGDGSRWINMVHRDDAASAIVAAATQGQPGRTYNVTDDGPVRQGDFLRWLAREYGVPEPPVADGTEAKPRKRGLTQKRVSNARLRTETGWVPQYPDYRRGYARGAWDATTSP